MGLPLIWSALALSAWLAVVLLLNLFTVQVMLVMLAKYCLVGCYLGIL